MGTKNESASVLLPAKFILLVIQCLLLTTILIDKEPHIYFAVSTTKLASTSISELKGSAETTLMGVTASWIAICGFEFINMVLGISVIPMFASLNLIQILLHMVGCFFTAWFILDEWTYERIWSLWGSFIIIPFLIEIGMIASIIAMNKEINRNRDITRA